MPIHEDKIDEGTLHATKCKRIACLIVALGMLAGWARAVEPDVVVPLWPVTVCRRA